MAKRTGPSKKSQGYVVFETSDIVAIATGFIRPSKNEKTGPMIQIWILVKDENPIAAVASGADKKICFDCPFMKQTVLVHTSKRKPELVRIEEHRGCYVGLDKAPLSIWKAWRKGNYPTLTNDYSVFAGRAVRFGAYGEPVKIPFSIIKAIAAQAGRASITGYTHQWRNPLFAAYKEFLMASTSDADYSEAVAAGWRAFAVSEHPLDGAITCPASKEAGKRTTCFDCGLCAGTSKRARNITIKAH